VKWFSRLFGVGLAAVLTMLPATKTEARPCEQPCPALPGWASANGVGAVAGFSIRNGDWVAVDGMGILLLGAPTANRMTAFVVRGEVGLGGSSVGIGLATNALRGPDYRLACSCKMDEFIGSGILSLEARVERMYGPTTWRNTTYVGWQVSFAAIIFKPALGCVVAADNPRDRHCQIATGAGW